VLGERLKGEVSSPKIQQQGFRLGRFSDLSEQDRGGVGPSPTHPGHIAIFVAARGVALADPYERRVIR